MDVKKTYSRREVRKLENKIWDLSQENKELIKKWTAMNLEVGHIATRHLDMIDQIEKTVFYFFSIIKKEKEFLNAFSKTLKSEDENE